MDFFGYQEQARKKTTRLVMLFAVAVACIVFSVYVVVATVLQVVYSKNGGGALYAFGPEYDAYPFWSGMLFFWVTLVATAVILVVSLYKIHTLSQGGRIVAQMLGGRQVNPSSGDPGEKRLMNIVEEMAIASGVPVPPVYILDGESGINAFAAGYSPGDAVIAVTRGSLSMLTRDELQGVVAHEFSHILNGDMKLDIRIIGVLSGILAFAVAGYYLMRGTIRVRDWRVAIAGAIVGGALVVIGYTGVFFSRIIKCAVSRQREYLADASAIQFTRNPGGIAGALKKIGGFTGGAKIRHFRAEEMSHIFFAQGVSGWISSLFSTHPPLADRVRRIEPSFSGRFEPVTEQYHPVHDPARRFSSTGQETVCGVERGMKIPLDSGQLVSSVGRPHYEHLACARQLIASIPPAVFDAARNPATAPGVAFCLLLSDDSATRERQIEIIRRSVLVSALQKDDAAIVSTLIGLKCDATIRLVLADIAIASLRVLSAQQYEDFSKTIKVLVEIDESITLFEYMLQNMIVRNLERVFSRQKQQRAVYQAIEALLPHYTKLVSTLSYYGTTDSAKAELAFEAAKMRAGIKEPIALLPVEQAGIMAVHGALNALNGAAPKIKRLILESAASAVAFDGHVTVEEAELLRCIADVLDCPVPPILPGDIRY